MNFRNVKHRFSVCKKILSVASVVFVMVSGVVPTQADILEQINYQGKLTNASGITVPNGNYDVIFKIYDASTSGSVLWTGTYTTLNGNSITVTDGIFSILLGSGTGNTLSLDFSTDTYYLGVTVGSDAEMTPRKRIGSVPQAVNAKNLKSNGYINIAGLPTGTGVSQGTVYINPISASSGQTLLGAAVNGTQKIRLTEAGNLEIAGAITSGAWNGTTIATAYGGTGATTLGLPGALVYSNGSQYAFSGVGTLGQALVSGSSGSPTWFAPTAGSVLFAGVSGILQQNNADFFWDSTNNRLGVGTNSPSNRLSVYSNVSADGVSIDGSNDPAFVAKSNGVVRGYWTTATSSSSFFGDSLANDMIFRAETGGARVLFGVGFGSSTMAVSVSGVTMAGNFGIGDTTPASALTVGNGDLFQVNSSGAIIAATGITSSGSIQLSGFTSNGGSLYTNNSGVLAQATAGTTTQVLHGGTVPTFSSVSLSGDVAGTLAVTNGGTGVVTHTNAYGLIASGTTATGAEQTLATGATTDILVSGGPSALPVWTTATGSGSPVRATSPTFITPALGTPSSGVATNLTNLPIAGGLLAQSFQDFRLTLTTAVPVTTADVTGATTIYCTPYKGNNISLYDGTKWNIRSSAQFSLALGTLTSAKPYDVFVYDNAGTPTLEFLAWTSDTARATALVYQDGVLVKSGATTRRYLGSFYTTATTTTEDSVSKRYLYNYYNRVKKSLYVSDVTASWAYSTATFRQANGNAANQVALLIGVDEDAVECTLEMGGVTNSTATSRLVFATIGLDSTTTPAGTTSALYTNNSINQAGSSTYRKNTGIGKHYLAWIEKGAGADTQTWLGAGWSSMQGSVNL